MNETKLLLNTYYEILHDLLVANRHVLAGRIEKLLQDEFSKHEFGNIDEEKLDAYMDACLAFVDERIEMYNPIGIQYTFDSTRRHQAFELELQLNFYDGLAEFKALVEAAQTKLQARTDELELSELADELIKEVEIEYYRSSGPGGQHKNKTETAVRMHHPPSGVTVRCSDTRSQSQNRRIALKRLAARLEKLNRPKKTRVKTKPTQASRERRLQQKRAHTDKKRSRRKVDPDGQ